MNLVETSGWEDFQQQLSAIQEEEKSQGRRAQFLFRGVCDSTWPLKTTLERAGWEDVLVNEYYGLISRLKPQIESYTSQKWDIPEPPEVQELLDKIDAWSLHQFPTPEIYLYMVYLRHHGFPSPLLDWTRSRFSAAFFAFRRSSAPKEGKVSIFAYSEVPELFHVDSNSDPWIRSIGEYVRTHRRHFLQQSDYTMCGIF
ncbi:MAG TPA: FRG domain-containing protein [Terriglobia bacterium]|nr:FRG domain-containing protein [Terriglobia bacterium]HKT12899.1 FRG domain-containing protein [Terriglobia bacterium]